MFDLFTEEISLVVSICINRSHFNSFWCFFSSISEKSACFDITQDFLKALAVPCVNLSYTGGGGAQSARANFKDSAKFGDFSLNLSEKTMVR